MNQACSSDGWKLPSTDDWKTLVESQASVGCEGGSSHQRCPPAGDKLKVANKCSNTSNCGDSGFNAILAGLVKVGGSDI